MLRQNFPLTRLRRLRQHDGWRELLAEYRLSPKDFILPIFICADDSPSAAIEIQSMPKVKRYRLAELSNLADKVVDNKIPAIMLFPETPKALKTSDGKEAFNDKNLVSRAIQQLKKTHPELLIIADVALDPYTDHGHDGLVVDGKIANDKTVAALVKQALQLAAMGADAVAPSDMMDGRVLAIRQAFEKNGYQDKVIISYAVKYASQFYGPFRDAIGAAMLGKNTTATKLMPKDKKTYQMAVSNSDEAMLEIAMDLNEGADAIIIKPALPFLDVIARAKQQFQAPLIAYQVSGEYSSLMLGSRLPELQNIKHETLLLESLLSIKRSGANAIITYGALLAAEWLKQ